MKIGLFDSGIGGTTVLEAIKKILPHEEYKYLADSKNCPYGEKSSAELKTIAKRNVEILKNWGAKIIVIACNTATVKCIAFLHQQYPELQFVGTGPAIKLATDTDAKNILVIATPNTIKSARMKSLLKENQKPGQTIQFLACPGLADLIEHNYSSNNTSQILDYLEKLFQKVTPTPEVIVLGCTHYSLIKPEIQSFFEAAKLIDNSLNVAHQVKELVENPKNLL